MAQGQHRKLLLTMPSSQVDGNNGTLSRGSFTMPHAYSQQHSVVQQLVPRKRDEQFAELRASQPFLLVVCQQQEGKQ